MPEAANQQQNTVPEAQGQRLTQIDITPLIASAFAINEKIYSDIDALYETNREAFYKLSRESVFYNRERVKISDRMIR